MGTPASGNVNMIGTTALTDLYKAEVLYREFLRRIRLQKTVVVTPENFNRIINIAMLEWIKSKLPLHQFNQKRVEDLQILHVDTDGVFYPLITTKGNSGGNEMLFRYPTFSQSDYPSLLHGINAMFKINYVSSPCHSDGVSGFLPGKYLKANNRSSAVTNTYTRANDEFVYFEIISDYVRIMTGKNTGISSSTGHSMKLEYYRYPNEICYDTDPLKCNDSEFSPSSNSEIIDLAVVAYLENHENKRLESFIAVDRNKEK